MFRSLETPPGTDDGKELADNFQFEVVLSLMGDFGLGLSAKVSGDLARDFSEC